MDLPARTIPQAQQAKRNKMIVSVIFAAVATFVFLYFVYAFFIQQDGALFQKIQTPMNGVQKNISLPVQQNIVTGAQVDVLENRIRENTRLQKLEKYRTDENGVTYGNSQPFKPFEQGIRTDERSNLIFIDDIDKPKPRAN